MPERVILRLDNDGKLMHYYQSVEAETDDEAVAKAVAVVVSNIQVSKRGNDPQLWLSKRNYRIVEVEEAFSMMAMVEPELVNVV